MSPIFQLGLVCFRLEGSNALNQKLLSSINASGKIHMVPASLNDKFVIRFCVCRETAQDSDISELNGFYIHLNLSNSRYELQPNLYFLMQRGVATLFLDFDLRLNNFLLHISANSDNDE
jgi:hypothetical protein